MVRDAGLTWFSESTHLASRSCNAHINSLIDTFKGRYKKANGKVVKLRLRMHCNTGQVFGFTHRKVGALKPRIPQASSRLLVGCVYGSRRMLRSKYFALLYVELFSSGSAKTLGAG